MCHSSEANDERHWGFSPSAVHLQIFTKVPIVALQEQITSYNESFTILSSFDSMSSLALTTIIVDKKTTFT